MTHAAVTFWVSATSRGVTPWVVNHASTRIAQATLSTERDVRLAVELRQRDDLLPRQAVGRQEHGQNRQLDRRGRDEGTATDREGEAQVDVSRLHEVVDLARTRYRQRDPHRLGREPAMEVRRNPARSGP